MSDNDQISYRKIWTDSGVCFVFTNENDSQAFKIGMSFEGLGNLKLRHADEDATDAEIIVKANSSVPFFLNPINAGEDTTFRMPKMTSTSFDDDCDD